MNDSDSATATTREIRTTVSPHYRKRRAGINHPITAPAPSLHLLVFGGDPADMADKTPDQSWPSGSADSRSNQRRTRKGAASGSKNQRRLMTWSLPPASLKTLLCAALTGPYRHGTKLPLEHARRLARRYLDARFQPADDQFI
jgi:hypothetical protein